MKISLAVEAASAVRGVVDAGLAGFIARNALPVARATVSNSSSGADLVAVALVHEVAISAVVADQVFSAALASFRTSLAHGSNSSEAIVALDLAR